MHRVRTPQHALALMTMAASVVAGAVLLWGTAWQCSLYAGHSDKHVRIAAATLLSEKERPLVDQAADTFAASRSLPVVFAFSPIVGTQNRAGNGTFLPAIPLACGEAGATRFSSLHSFLFRPPPDFAA